eukprot:3650829-Pleurochrysis_carterae.AAC.2
MQGDTRRSRRASPTLHVQVACCARAWPRLRPCHSTPRSEKKGSREKRAEELASERDELAPQ